MDKIILSDTDLAMISNSPFNQFFDLPRSRVNVYVLDTIIGNYLGENSFLVNGEKMDFTKDKFVEILGLPTGIESIEINYNIEDTLEIEKLFPSKDNIVRWEIKKVIEKVMCDRSHLSPNVLVKLWLLFVLVAYLLPDSSCSIPKGLFAYVNNFEEIGKYDWASFTYDMLFKNIKTCHNRIKQREKTSRKATTYLFGCSMALCVSVTLLYLCYFYK